MFLHETPNRPIKREEVITALKSLVESGDPLVKLRVKFRSISKYRQMGPYGSYSAHLFRPPGAGVYFRREGQATEVLQKFILSVNGERDDIHPRNGEVIQAVRIYTPGPMGIPVDKLRYPPKVS